MENQPTFTVKISAPRAVGFDRVVVLWGEGDGVPEHVGLAEHDPESVTIELMPAE
jgi:hypothetical protein